jgi:hypothetical protein
MVYLTLNSVILGLDDLLQKRLPALQSFDAGKSAVKPLTVRRDKIAALPPELKGRPLADELSVADGRHDGCGGAMRCYLDAVLRHPDSSPELVAAAKKLLSDFVPTFEALQARYDVEANSAKGREALLTTLHPELTMFPVPVPAGGTLLDWATAHVDAGKQLATLLSQRADAKSRKAASTLRTEVVSKLTRLREDLLEALKDDPDLPADLEAQVFGYLDLLEKADADAAAAEKKKGTAKKPDESDPSKPV